MSTFAQRTLALQPYYLLHDDNIGNQMLEIEPEALLIVQQRIQRSKARPKWSQPTLGKLPSSRLTPTSFAHTDIEYCGPLYIKSGKIKNSKIVKRYISIIMWMLRNQGHTSRVDVGSCCYWNDLSRGTESARILFTLKTRQTSLEPTTNCRISRNLFLTQFVINIYY